MVKKLAETTKEPPSPKKQVKHEPTLVRGAASAPGIKELLEKHEKELERFQSEILSKFEHYVVGITMLPDLQQLQPPAGFAPLPSAGAVEAGAVDGLSGLSALQRDGEKKDEAEKKEKVIPLLVLVDDSDVKRMTKAELKDRLFTILGKTAADINKQFKVETMLMSELRENCFDAKWEVTGLIAMSGIFYDPNDVLQALKVSDIHKNMVLKKFDKYIVSYVAAGSLFRGDARSHDIDVFVVVDDTDVKRMPRVELRDKLGAIIRDMGLDASEITQVKKQFHIQVYILTDFLEAIKEANPVIFTFIRDGVPLYDRGVFMPWKLLLNMGRIKPSPEAIDMFMDVGERLLSRARGKLLSVIGEDLYYATMNPAQAALMLYGLPPATHKETIKLMQEVFVEKEKILEKKYVDIVDKTLRYYKDIEHGKITDVTGKEIDQILGEVDDYLKRINKLFAEIEKRTTKQKVKEFHEHVVRAVVDAIKAETGKEVALDNMTELKRQFKKLIDDGVFPKDYLKRFEKAIEVHEQASQLHRMEVEMMIRDSGSFIRGLQDYVQRKRGVEVERARVRVKYGDQFGEVYLLDDVAFLVMDVDAASREIQKAKLLPNGGLGDIQKSAIEELERALMEKKIPEKVFIKEKIFEDLKKVFGKDVEVLVRR